MDLNNTIENGFNLPVWGLENGLFYPMHSVAMSSIFISLVCAALVFIFAVRKKTPFFKRPKCERFVVYLSFCDGCFNVFHLIDHTHYVITRSHPIHSWICSFYSFMICVFVMAQMLCVNVIAINTFRMVYYGHKPNYGKWDYQLLTYMFGVPLCMAVLFASMGQLGPNGYYCGFDGVRGGMILLLFTTIPPGIIIAINSVLYILIWRKLLLEAKRMKDTVGPEAITVKASQRSAKIMTLLVAMFVIQWTPSVVFGVLEMLNMHFAVVIFSVVLISNAGGVLNGVTYLVIHRNNVRGTPRQSATFKPNIATTRT